MFFLFFWRVNRHHHHFFVSSCGEQGQREQAVCVQESKPSTPAVHVSVHGRCSTNNCRHFRSPALTGVTGRGLVEDSSSLRKREQHSREEEVKKKGKVEGWEGERGLVEDELWAAHYWCAWERQIDLLLGRVAVLERHRQVVLLLLLLLGSLHHTNTHTNTNKHTQTSVLPRLSPLIATPMCSRTEAHKQCTADDDSRPGSVP